MKSLVSIFLGLLVMTSSASASTITFSKDFIVFTVHGVDNDPGKKVTIHPFQTFSGTGYGHDGISAFPVFRMVFTHPGIDFSSGYKNLEPEELNIYWEGSCENGAKTFKGEMVSYETLRVVMNKKDGKVSIHGVGVVVGDCK
ncbi:hypothetical protein ACES2I_06110 [Bdellovibrio bacteriovorus]|uniref:hypothetical protein n=1 Tax=Bdellovibrio bacteriovorus TaxID=959 RepID=UPI0035A6ABAD